MKPHEVLNLFWYLWRSNNWMLVVCSANMWNSSFYENMLPAPHHRIPFGSRFRDRWYPLSLDRALHYIEKAPPEDLKIIKARYGSLAKKLKYD